MLEGFLLTFGRQFRFTVQSGRRSGQAAESSAIVSPIEPYIPGLFRFAIATCKDAAIAEDLTQETLLRALGAKHRPATADGLQPWLFTILANIWRDECKAARNRLREENHELEGPTTAEGETSTLELMIERETHAAIYSRMQELPDRQRQVLYLRAVEELSIDEIAQVLQLNRNAVKASLSIARKAMRNWCEKQSNSDKTLRNA